MFVVRVDNCVECGKEFTVTLDEFVQKMNNGMKMPKRCQACRRKNREKPNPYKGIYSVMRQYPSTKGHHRTVHGGAL